MLPTNSSGTATNSAGIRHLHASAFVSQRKQASSVAIHKVMKTGHGRAANGRMS